MSPNTKQEEIDRKWLTVSDCMANEHSRCKKRKCGAVIVDIHGRVAGTGYNFHPKKTALDHVCLREGLKSGSNNDIGYCCHAEINAMIHTDFAAMQGATIYLTHAPCIQCARYILQSGIKRLVYYTDEQERIDGISLIKDLIAGCSDERFSMTSYHRTA